MNYDLHDLTISQTKQDLLNKSYSAVELTKAYLTRIKEVDSALHAFITVTEDTALKQARHADRLIAQGDFLPLLGIPLVIKDNFCTKGIKTTASSYVLDDFIPPYNATVVTKLLNAGIVLLGKTNMDAWAHGSSTETSDYGPTKNPWDLTRLPGGSSGGSAAAVAAGETVAAIGSETAGSIRQPASWCGVVGLKPTYGRVSRYGVIAMASSTDSPGPLTKTVEDAAVIYSLIAGHDPFDATSANRLVAMDFTEMKQKNKPMTIGICSDYFDGVDGEVVEKVNAAIKVLEKLGHRMQTVQLLSPTYAIDVYTIIQRSEVSSNLARFDGIRYGNGRESFGEEAKRRIMLGTYALSAGYYDAYYKNAQKVRTLIIENFNAAFSQVDAIIAPTSPSPALPIGSSKDHPMFGEIADVLVEASSIAGLPGINLPCGFTKNRLPVGFQIIGPQFAESVIVNLAWQYEQHSGMRKEKPVL